MRPVDLHRRPGEESVGLYPGLVVSDGEHSRQSGSITVGRTRLPVWSFIGGVIWSGWDAVDDYYDGGDEAEFGKQAATAFFAHLTNQRGEFGRLVLLLADVERASTARWDWTESRKQRKRLADQLRRCLALLEEGESG